MLITLFLTMLSIISGCVSEKSAEIRMEGNTNQMQDTSLNTRLDPGPGSTLEMKHLPQALIDMQYKAVYEQLSAEFQQSVSEQEIKKLSQSFFQPNDVFSLQAEYSLNGLIEYVWTDSQENKGVSAVLDEDNTIWGLQIVNLTAHPESDDTFTKQEYSLPFKEEWFTYWGGRNVLLNYHYAYESQRYAYDFFIAKENRTFAAEADAANGSYYAFGQEVIAPADGVVVQVVNDVADNKPGTADETQPAGNYIIIDHDGEYSILAHFMEGSILVKQGQQVKRGETIGLCGNSGNSSEPHIHFQVSDQPSLEQGKSLRIQFKDGVDPIKGQFLQGEP